MTQEEDEHLVQNLKQSRRFNPKSLADWFDLGIKSITFVAMLIAGLSAAIAFLIPALAPEWASLPEKVEANTEIALASAEVGSANATTLAEIQSSLATGRPQLIDFRGNLIVPNPVVEAGGVLGVVALLRRNASCDTRIRVRFWDHNNNTIASRYTNTIDATKAPVTQIFIPFALQVSIPANMQEGVYSYFAEVIPINCGVYEPLQAPMSEPFRVVQSPP
jgi:hypothetical protein